MLDVPNMLKAIYHYRGFIISSIKRDFQSRYQTSMLGALWLVLQPLAMILVYTLVFSQVMKARMPDNTGSFAYSIYLCSGVLTWGLFTEILDKSQGVFINNANLIKKISFPKICLPIIVIASAVLNFLIIFSLFIIFLIFTGNFPGWLIFSMIPVVLIQIAFAAGLGMIFGVMNVFFRDVGAADGRPTMTARQGALGGGAGATAATARRAEGQPGGVVGAGSKKLNQNFHKCGLYRRSIGHDSWHKP